MINKTEISSAIAAADAPIMVESAADLELAIDIWQQCDVIGIDTEFVRERTYRADLGLVQLSDGHQVWLVDPLKTGPLQPLAPFFENKEVTKILHAPPEDLSVLLNTTGSSPWPLFDTQTACAMLGQSLQMGYHKTVEWLLEIAIDKGETRSNWLKRPLRPAQLNYAALDVCLLPLMQCELLNRHEALDRLHWLEEDNLARGFVVKDAALTIIAKAQALNADELIDMGLMHPKVIERNEQTIVSMIEEVLQSGIQVPPPEALNSKQRKLIASMRECVIGKAEELSVDPALLASKRELESLIFTADGDEIPERFLGWRKTVISDELVALKEQAAC